LNFVGCRGQIVMSGLSQVEMSGSGQTIEDGERPD
jgi:hypothetical protein